MPAIAGDLVAGLLKGLAEGSKVIFGTDKPVKETHANVTGTSLDDSELAAAKKLLASNKSRASDRD